MLFHPLNEYVAAQIISLTPEIAENHVHNEWWDDESLKDHFDPLPIDRYWDWKSLGIEWEGRPLASEKVAIVAGDVRPVQGAMMISTEPVESVLQAGQRGLFVELLFTAPQNRPKLRWDGLEFFKGVGIKLLTWGAWLSRELGYGGCIRLDGSSEYLDRYRKRGLQTLGLESILYEGVNYTPMELSVDAAETLLKRYWDAE